MFPKASPSSIRSVVATIACDATSTWARAFRCTGVVRSTCPVGPAAVHRISDTRWHSPISAYGCTITLLAVIHEGVATIIRHTPSPGACLRASFLAVVYASGLMQPSVFPAQPPPSVTATRRLLEVFTRAVPSLPILVQYQFDAPVARYWFHIVSPSARLYP